MLSRVATLLAEQHPNGRGAAALLALRADAQRAGQERLAPLMRHQSAADDGLGWWWRWRRLGGGGRRKFR